MEGAQAQGNLTAIQEQQLRTLRKKKKSEKNAEAEKSKKAIVPVKAKIRRKLPGDITRVTEPTVYLPSSDRATAAGNPSSRVLEAFYGEPGLNGNNYYKAFELNVKGAINADYDRHQKSVYYASALCCLVPSLKPAVVKACENLGHAISEINIPRDAQRMNISTRKIMDGPTAAAMWGLIVLMLFKNPSAVNYGEFSNRRKKALRAVANMIDSNDLIVFNDVESASQFSGAFGQQTFKRELFYQILDLSQQNLGPLSQVCLYIKTILQWTELAGFLFVLNSIILTNSALLELDELKGEVRNFYHAMSLLADHPHPAYYKIVGPVATFTAFERQKYPTLIAVARELKAQTTKTVSQFVTPFGEEKERIQALAALHTKMYLGETNQGIKMDIQYLTQQFDAFEDEESEDEEEED